MECYCENQTLACLMLLMREHLGSTVAKQIKQLVEQVWLVDQHFDNEVDECVYASGDFAGTEEARY